MAEAKGKARVLILGGGFGGIYTALRLEKILRADEADITLVSRDNYFVFQPLLADIISGAIETTHVVVPLRRMLRGVEVEVGYVDDIDTTGRRVTVRRRQSGERFSIGYDALVIALGSVTDFRAVPGMAEHALGVRTLGDAFYLRNRALGQLEDVWWKNGSEAAAVAPRISHSAGEPSSTSTMAAMKALHTQNAGQ